MVIEAWAARRAIIRHSIGDRSCASSRMTCRYTSSTGSSASATGSGSASTRHVPLLAVRVEAVDPAHHLVPLAQDDRGRPALRAPSSRCCRWTGRTARSASASPGANSCQPSLRPQLRTKVSARRSAACQLAQLPLGHRGWPRSRGLAQNLGELVEQRYVVDRPLPVLRGQDILRGQRRPPRVQETLSRDLLAVQHRPESTSAAMARAPLGLMPAWPRSVS